MPSEIDLDYAPFGEDFNPNGSGYKFSGKEDDVSTGLYYFNARYYDPAAGRFITEDPAKDGGNWYLYCGNNPLRYVDLSGLKVQFTGEKEDIDNKVWKYKTQFSFKYFFIRERYPTGKEVNVHELLRHGLDHRKGIMFDNTISNYNIKDLLENNARKRTNELRKLYGYPYRVLK